MMKFIKWYALEIYSVIALVALLCAGLMDDQSPQQKILMVYMLLFIFHEWEEGRYPGGFLNIISDRILCREVPDDIKRGSRLPAGIFLLLLTWVPFIFHQSMVLVLVPVFLGLFEGVVHIAFIKIGELEKPYSPGMVTAELELLLSIGVIVHFGMQGLITSMEALFAFLLMVVCFMGLQKTLFAMLGLPYRELPKIMRARIQYLKSKRSL